MLMPLFAMLDPKYSEVQCPRIGRSDMSTVHGAQPELIDLIARHRRHAELEYSARACRADGGDFPAISEDTKLERLALQTRSALQIEPQAQLAFSRTTDDDCRVAIDPPERITTEVFQRVPATTEENAVLRQAPAEQLMAIGGRTNIVVIRVQQPKEVQIIATTAGADGRRHGCSFLQL